MLKKDTPNHKIPHHSLFMLHVELLRDISPEYTSPIWSLDSPRPESLLDPTPYLFMSVQEHLTKNGIR